MLRFTQFFVVNKKKGAQKLSALRGVFEIHLEKIFSFRDYSLKARIPMSTDNTAFG
jgi:hypothetical protein